MPIPVYLVDAFVNHTFSGNPAGVCVLEQPAAEAWMQTVACELNQAETAFVHAQTDGGWGLRWFTPVREIELCGHATMAAAHVLITTERTTAPVHFHTLSGILTVANKEEGYAMNFPARPCEEDIEARVLEAALNTDVAVARASESMFLAELESEEAVASHQPDFAKIAALGKIGLIITAAGTGSDFVSRFYAPNYGVPEDPATGSAHCALGPYWASKLGNSKMVGHQLSSRGGEIGVEVQGDRVILSGFARTFLSGHLD